MSDITSHDFDHADELARGRGIDAQVLVSAGDVAQLGDPQASTYTQEGSN